MKSCLRVGFFDKMTLKNVKCMSVKVDTGAWDRDLQQLRG